MTKKQIVQFNKNYKVCTVSVIVASTEVDEVIQCMSDFSSNIGLYTTDLCVRNVKESERVIFENEFPYPIFDEEETTK